MPIPTYKSTFAAITLVSAALASPGLAAPASLPTVSQKAEDTGICSGATSWARTDKVLTCTCPANFNISTSLWGTDIYTADSYICSTALHASVIDRSGGRLTIQMLPGQNSYAGTRRNGVSTRSYGAYTASYRFVNVSNADASGTSATDLNAVDAGGKKSRSGNPFKKDASAILDSIGSGRLGRTADKLAGENIGECHGATKWRGSGKVLACTCPANFSISAPTWGTDIYTDDSYVCKAALHAGRLGRSGGQVSIQMLPGQSSYAGTTRNGITTLSYRSHSGSYRFN